MPGEVCSEKDGRYGCFANSLIISLTQLRDMIISSELLDFGHPVHLFEFMSMKCDLKQSYVNLLSPLGGNVLITCQVSEHDQIK